MRFLVRVVTPESGVRGDLRGRVVRGLGANAYNQIVIVVVQLAGVPILLHCWGAQLYGEWLILFAIPAYLSVTNLGFSQSARNDMTASVARGDTRSALAVFHSLSALVCLVAGVGMVLSTLVIAVLPIGKWMHFSVLTSSDARWVLWLLASEVLLRLLDGVVHAGFQANGEYPFHYFAYSTTLLLQQASVWVVAALGHGPVTAALTFAGVRWVAEPVLASILFFRHRWLEPGFRHASTRELRRLARPAMANLAVPLSQAINLQGMVLVVGSILGPVSVVVFSTLRTLTRFPLRLASGISLTTEPELAAAWGLEDYPLLRQLYLRGLSASLWGAMSLAVILLIAGRAILSFWTHAKVPMDIHLFHWLLITSILAVLWSSSLMLLTSANLHLKAAVWYVFSSFAGVALAETLLRYTGILADAGLALVVMDGLMAAYLVYAAGSLVRLGPVRVLLKAADPLPLFKLLIARRAHDVQGRGLFSFRRGDGVR